MTNSFSSVYNRDGAFIFYKSSRACFFDKAGISKPTEEP